MLADLFMVVIGCAPFTSRPSEVANPDKNAVLCSCECDPARGPVAIPWKNFIAAGADDATQGKIDGNQLNLGQNTVGFRFLKLGVPPLATITSAQIQFTPAQSSSGGTALQIHMVDVSSALPLGRRSSISTRSR